MLLLLRNGLRDTFMPPSREEAGGGRRRRRTSGRGYLAGVALSWAVVAALAALYMAAMASVFGRLGMLDLILLIGIVGSSTMALVLTIFRAKSLLFDFRDYDLVCSLPFSMGQVTTSRFLLLYVWNLAYTIALMIPAGVVYAIYGTVQAGFWPAWILLTLFVPLIPSVLAAVIGMLIGLVSRRFKKHAGVEIIATVAFLVVWMLFVNSLQDVSDEEMAGVASAILSSMAAVYPLAPMALAAAADLDMGQLAAFCGISLGGYLLFYAIVAPRFRRIHAALTASRVAGTYRMGRLRNASASKALARREWQRLVGIPGYFMNTAVGPILMVVFAVMMIFGFAGAGVDMTMFGGASLETSVIGDLPMEPGLVIGMFFGLFCMIGAPSCASISLEGRTLWILKTLPVGGWDILRAKLVPGISMTAAASLISGTVLWCLFPSMGAWGVLLYLVPISYGVFSSLFGLRLNLRYPDFEWTTPLRPVKQATPVVIQTFSGMGIAGAGVGLTFLLGNWAAVGMLAVMAVCCALLLRSLTTWGVSRFESLYA